MKSILEYMQNVDTWSTEDILTRITRLAYMLDTKKEYKQKSENLELALESRLDILNQLGACYIILRHRYQSEFIRFLGTASASQEELKSKIKGSLYE